MKRRNTILKTFLLFLMVGTLLASCRKNTGPDPRDQYLGIYNAVDECSFDTLSYRVDIFKEGNNNLILLSGDGLYNAGIEVEAIVTGSKIVIPIQRYLISSFPDVSYEFTGNGNFDGTRLVIAYTILTIQDEIIIGTDSCRVVLTKQ